MTDNKTFSSSRPYRVRFWSPVAASLLVLAAAGSAAAFSQTTKVEGHVGMDIGGVWLSVQDLMPEFRVRYHRVASEESKEIKPLPFKVGPLPDEYNMGGAAPGVMITEISDARRAADYGIIEKDVIVAVDSANIADLAAYEEAIKEAGEWVSLQIRRPALSYSTIRLIKINYHAKEGSADAPEGISTVGSENIDVSVSEVAFPFDGRVNEARAARKFWKPTAEDIATLKTSWFELPAPEHAVFVSGEHRVVGQDALTPDISDDPNFEGARFALVSNLNGNPLRGAGKNISIYGAREISPDSISGGYIEAAMGNAPFPITVEFKGRFKMIKIDEFSNKDVALRMKLHQNDEPEEDYDKIKVAPDIPADL